MLNGYVTLPFKLRANGCNNSQHCWELSSACWQWCAKKCNNSQQRWDLQCIMGRIQPIRLCKPCVVRVRSPNNVERAVQTGWIQNCCATLQLSWNKRNVGSCWTKSRVWPVSNFRQQHPTTCNRVGKRTQHITSNNFGSCWLTMLRPFDCTKSYTPRASKLCQFWIIKIHTWLRGWGK